MAIFFFLSYWINLSQVIIYKLKDFLTNYQLLRNLAKGCTHTHRLTFDNRYLEYIVQTYVNADDFDTHEDMSRISTMLHRAD